MFNATNPKNPSFASTDPHSSVQLRDYVATQIFVALMQQAGIAPVTGDSTAMKQRAEHLAKNAFEYAERFLHMRNL